MRRVLLVAVVIFALTGGVATAKKFITSRDIKNGTIQTVDMSSRAKKALRGQAGPSGPAGPTGPVGAPGPSAVARLAPWTASGVVLAGTVNSLTAVCPAGQRVVSGGYTTDAGVAFFDTTFDGASWSVGIDNFDSTVNADVEVTALCAPAGVAVAASTNKSKRNAKIERAERKRRATHAH